MLSRSVQGYRKKLPVVGLIIFVFVLLVISYANAAYQVQRPISNTGGKINQTYLWGESTTINGGTPVSHKGVDFPYGTGTQVYATDAGTVVQVRQNWQDNDKSANDLWGNYVLIRHSRQHYDRTNAQWAYVYSLYLHLSQNTVTVGQGNAVSAGQSIAQSDNTGQYSSGAHLHYQVIVNSDVNATLEPNNTLGSETRSRNPELWLAPFNFNNVNTARAVGRLSDVNGNPIGGKLIVGLQKPAGAGGTCGANGYATSRTYSYGWTNPDDMLVENFGTTDVAAGSYHLYAYDSFNATTCLGVNQFRDLGNYTFVAGQTTYIGLYPVYLPDVRGNVLGGWNSSITIRNNSTVRTAQVTTSYFTQGGTLTNQRTDSIAVNGNLTFAAPTGLGNGSAMVVGSEDIAVVAVHQIGSGSTYATEAYPGVDHPIADVHIPIVQKNNSGTNNPNFWNSYIYVQNAGNAAANIAVEFFPVAGSGNYYSYNENNVAPGTVRRIDVSTKPIGLARADYPTVLKFIGAVHLSNAQNQPLAVTSTQYNGSSQLMETSNTQPPAPIVYAPLIQNQNAGWQTGLALRRTGGGGNFTIQYFNNGNSCFIEPAAAGNPDPRIIYPAPSGVGCPVVPTAIFQAGSAIVVNVNQLQGTTNATTYAAIAQPALTAIVPKVWNSSGWWDGFTIMNTSGAAANVTVSLYNSNGSLNATPFSNSPLGARQSLIVLGQIPVNFVGSAVVTSSQPIAVQANSRNIANAGDNIGSYPAIHR